MRRGDDLGFARVCIFLALFASIAFRFLGQGEAQAGEQSARADVTLELVQTVPVETDLGLPGLRDSHVVWLEMIEGATESLDLAHFYAVDMPPREGASPEEPPPTSRLTPIVAAIEAASQRGVAVRFLADAGFHKTYPEMLDALGALAGVEMRLYDLREVTGGVQHSKWMIVDGREGFLGSQNFDWRAMEHITELGVRFTGDALCGVFGELFERDWRQAADESTRVAFDADVALPALPIEVAGGGEVTPVMSPHGLVTAEELWDLPHLIGLIDGAESRVRLQFLSYKPKRDGGRWGDLDDALRRAAKRGVQVQLLLSHWSTRRSAMDALRNLHATEGIEVRFLTVPEHSGGFLPFARVAHAKLIAVDGGAGAWIGTSNASGDYFHASRNVGLVLRGGETPRALDRYFGIGWGSEHTHALDPERDYPEPRVAE